MARRKLTKESVDQAAQKWANGYSGSAANITAGVQNFNGDLPALTIAQQNLMTQNWTAAIQSGRWAEALRQSGTQGWKDGMLKKTVPGLGTRATAGQPHYLAFLQAWAPAIQSATRQLPPRGTFDQNKARATQMMDWEHAQRGKYRKLWRRGVAPNFQP